MGHTAGERIEVEEGPKRQYIVGGCGVVFGGEVRCIARVERRSRGMREGCNAETCQKRAPGPPFGMWPVCLPRKNRTGEREEREKKGKRGQIHVLLHHRREGGRKTKSIVVGQKEGEVEK